MGNPDEKIIKDAQDGAKKEEFVPVRIKPAEGEEVVLNENDLAVLVVLDPSTGQPVVYNIQNCPLRAFARMLMNEALMLYQLTSQIGRAHV